jgi:hypothetical protein
MPARSRHCARGRASAGVLAAVRGPFAARPPEIPGYDTSSRGYGRHHPAAGARSGGGGVAASENVREDATVWCEPVGGRRWACCSSWPDHWRSRSQRYRLAGTRPAPMPHRPHPYPPARLPPARRLRPARLRRTRPLRRGHRPHPAQRPRPQLHERAQPRRARSPGRALRLAPRLRRRAQVLRHQRLRRAFPQPVGPPGSIS